MKDNDLRQDDIRLLTPPFALWIITPERRWRMGVSLKVRLKIEQNLATVNLRITAHILARARSAVNKSEVILEVGAEGGNITLYGVRDSDGWRYSTSVLDQTPSLLPDECDEPEIRKESEVVNSWEAALRLIDRYPWHKLFPLTVHPEFCEQVWAAVQNRFASDRRPAEYWQLERWRELCEPRLL
jgi:hypothetical protein